jgi:hypothetical protein
MLCFCYLIGTILKNERDFMNEIKYPMAMICNRGQNYPPREELWQGSGEVVSSRTRLNRVIFSGF